MIDTVNSDVQYTETGINEPAGEGERTSDSANSASQEAEAGANAYASDVELLDPGSDSEPPAPPPSWGSSPQLDFMINAMNPKLAEPTPEPGTGVNENAGFVQKNVGPPPPPLARVSWETSSELAFKIELVNTAAINNETKTIALDGSIKAADAMLTQMNAAFDTAVEAADLTRAGAAQNFGLQIATSAVQGGTAVASVGVEMKKAPSGAEQGAFANRNTALADAKTAQTNLKAAELTVKDANTELNTAQAEVQAAEAALEIQKNEVTSAETALSDSIDKVIEATNERNIAMESLVNADSSAPLEPLNAKLEAAKASQTSAELKLQQQESYLLEGGAPELFAQGDRDFAKANLTKVTNDVQAKTTTNDEKQAKYQEANTEYEELKTNRVVDEPMLNAIGDALKAVSALAGTGSHLGMYLEAEARADASEATAESEVHKGLQTFASTVKSNTDSAMASADEKIKEADDALKEFLSSDTELVRAIWS